MFRAQIKKLFLLIFLLVLSFSSISSAERAQLIQTNFTGGEASPLLWGRVEIPRYQTSAQRLYNVNVLLTGGAKRRAGSVFVYNAGENITVRQVPFSVYRNDLAEMQDYIVEFRSDNKIRFYTNSAIILDGSAPYEIASPFMNADLSKVRYEQTKDTIYFVHPDFPPQKLIRSSDTSWEISEAPFTMPSPLTLAVEVDTITRSGATATVTTLAPHNYKNNTWITVTGADQAEYNGIFKAKKTGPSTFEITVTGLPATPATGTIIVYPMARITSSDGIATCSLSLKHGFDDGQFVEISGAVEPEYNGTFQVTVINDKRFSFTVSGAPASPATGTIVVRALVATIERTDDIATVSTNKAHGYLTNHVINIFGADQAEYNGDHIITKIDNNTFTFPVSGSPATPATGPIEVKRKYWASVGGYPSVITFFEQRLLIGGTRVQPVTFWASQTAEFEELVVDTGDIDPMEITLAAGRSMLKHLTATTLISAFTNDMEFTVQGTSDKPLTPTNIQIKSRSQHGSSLARPMRIGDLVIFTTKNKDRMRSFGYDFESNGYKTSDISIVSEHLASLGIEDTIQVYDPDSYIYARTTAGLLLPIAYDNDQQVIAWSQLETAGKITSITKINNNSKLQIWLAVERVIGGKTYTYIEYFDDDVMVDSAVVGTDVTGKTTWDVPHLAGRTVDIVADGIVMPQQTVTSSQIVLPRTAKAVHIGLHYDSEIKDLPPEFQTGTGTAQGQKMSVYNITVRLNETIGCSIYDDKSVLVEQLPYRTFGLGALDKAITPFTGDKSVSKLGWDSGVISIKQLHPLPMTVLSIIKKVRFEGND